MQWKPTDGPVKVKTWAELYALDGYTPKISKNEIKLGAMCGKYGMKDQKKERCSISECQTQHLNGAIVIMQDGGVAGIGHKCGRKYFPHQWKAIQFNYELIEKRERESIKWANALELANKIIDRLDELEPRISKHNRLRKSFKDRVPKSVVDEVCRRAEKNIPVITVARRLTEDELEIARATNDPSGVSGVAEHIVGSLEGLPLFRAGNDPWFIAEYRVRPACEAMFKDNGGSAVKLNRIVVDVATSGNLIEKIESGLVLSEKFFDAQNLQQLLKLPNARNVRLKALGISGSGEVWVTRE
jgi:hypothetical protein